MGRISSLHLHLLPARFPAFYLRLSDQGSALRLGSLVCSSSCLALLGNVSGRGVVVRANLQKQDKAHPIWLASGSGSLPSYPAISGLGAARLADLFLEPANALFGDFNRRGGDLPAPRSTRHREGTRVLTRLLHRDFRRGCNGDVMGSGRAIAALWRITCHASFLKLRRGDRLERDFPRAFGGVAA